MAETIYALSSGIGRAGVAVLRVSGPRAGDVVQRIARCQLAPRRASLAEIRNPLTAAPIDQALVFWFPGPHSFTGEDVVEFHVHGGRAVVAAALEAIALVDGVRAAEPGEFTRRAFANGKLDLSSVEGLADLIAADTELQRRQALAQFRGSVTKIGSGWRQTLIEAHALIEAHLDFPDEGEVPVDVTFEVGCTLTSLIHQFDEALDTRQQAEIVRDGAVVLISGPPNAGKSTLLNRIANRDVAIISEIPGTTRDLLEVTIDLNGVPVTLVDSAGIRETSDPIESQGIARTRERAERAHLVLWLTPAGEDSPAPEYPFERTRVVYTKSDLAEAPAGALAISASTGQGMKELMKVIYDGVSPSAGCIEPSLLTNRRQFECVHRASGAIKRGLISLQSMELELVAEELRYAARSLEELTGSISSEDLLDEVFGRFCLGK